MLGLESQREEEEEADRWGHPVSERGRATAYPFETA
jgi:hypothetical protein